MSIAVLMERITGRKPMSSINGRILKAGSEVLLWIVSSVVLVIIAMSFVLSYSAQVELAALARIPAAAAWAWPIIVDGTIVVATFGTLILHPRPQRLTRLYPWIVLGVFGGLSIYANGIHAVGGRISPIEAFIVGAVAPVALLTSTHLLVVMLTAPQKQLSDVELVRRAEREASRAYAAEHPEIATVAPPAKRKRPAAATAGALSRDALKARIVQHYESTGAWPAGSDVARWSGQSDRTGRRLVSDVSASYSAS